MLALEIVFLAVLFAVVVEIRWSPRKKNPNPTLTTNAATEAAPPSPPTAVRPGNPKCSNESTCSENRLNPSLGYHPDVFRHLVRAVSQFRSGRYHQSVIGVERGTQANPE